MGNRISITDKSSTAFDFSIVDRDSLRSGGNRPPSSSGRQTINSIDNVVKDDSLGGDEPQRSDSRQSQQGNRRQFKPIQFSEKRYLGIFFVLFCFILPASRTEKYEKN